MSAEVMSGGGSANLQSKSVLPASLPYTATPDSGYDGFSGLTIQKDANLVAENIVSGKTIYGINGSANAIKNEMFLLYTYDHAGQSGTFTSFIASPDANNIRNIKNGDFVYELIAYNNTQSGGVVMFLIRPWANVTLGTTMPTSFTIIAKDNGWTSDDSCKATFLDDGSLQISMPNYPMAQGSWYMIFVRIVLDN